MSVGEPTADRDCMLGVEDVGCWGVVDDNCFSEVTADLGQILDVVSLVVVTTFPEETMMHHMMDIKLVKQRITVLQIR